MTDHAEEQEMEAEALAAIFDTHFIPKDNVNGKKQWTITIYPEQGSDEDELQELNHVSIELEIELPETYPEEVVPVLKIKILRGLCDDPHGVELLRLAEEEAEANLGVPSIFAIAERLREWLVDHNKRGLDDTSAYASMIRKQQAQEEQEQKKAKASVFESQKTKETYSEAELEELAVRKRRAEGTPCNQENFDAWAAKFQAEMAAAKKAEEEAELDANEKPKQVLQTQQSNVSAQHQSGAKKMTGFDYFASKTTNLEALEAAAEKMEEEESEEEDEVPEVANEDLFDDDVDLDDLDFDDDDDEEEDDDDDEEDPDI